MGWGLRPQQRQTLAVKGEGPKGYCPSVLCTPLQVPITQSWQLEQAGQLEYKRMDITKGMCLSPPGHVPGPLPLPHLH